MSGQANEKLEAALRYVALGWAVFPVHSVRDGACTCGRACKRAGKHPVWRLAPDGLHSATKDPEVVRRWWTQAPWANVAVATGEVSGFVVIDVDEGPGKIGGESLDALQDAHERLPDTVEQLTGGGGRHLLFAHPGEPVPNGTNKLGKHLDVRGDGGYIVVAPSLHVSGREYGWEASSEPGEVELAALPDWLLALVRQRAGEDRPRPQAGPIRLTPLKKAEIRHALLFVNADDRDCWLTVGMALHSTDAGDVAYGLWEAWSQTSDKFNAQDQLRVWRSFKSGGVGLGSLFELAKRGGWVAPSKARAKARPKRQLSKGGSPPEGAPNDQCARQLSEGEGAGLETGSTAPSAPPEAAAGGRIPPPDGAGDDEPPPDPDWQMGFLRTDGGTPKANPANMELILRHDRDWAGVLQYCEFSNRIHKIKPPPYKGGREGEWSDADLAQARIWTAHRYRFCCSDGDTVAAVLVAAQRRARHPVREYLDGLRWDGVSRAPWLLVEICGADGPEAYLKAAATKWMIGAVARIYEPGCKFDYMLVFEGTQGQGKSTWAAVLGGEWFSDGPIPLGHVDAYQNIQGVWIQELAELASLNKSDSYQAKQFVSQRVDRYRPSYGRMAHTFQRQTVLFGTTNEKVWIRDPTGGRRFWPVRIPDGVRIGLDLLTGLRDQYWAEAVHLYRQGVLRYPTPEEERDLFRPQQELRMMSDSWEDLIEPWLELHPKDWVQAAEIFDECLGMKPALVQKAHEMRIAQIMQGLGWEKARKRVKTEMEMVKKQRWIYIRPGVKL